MNGLLFEFFDPHPIGPAAHLFHLLPVMLCAHQQVGPTAMTLLDIQTHYANSGKVFSKTQWQILARIRQWLWKIHGRTEWH